MKTHNKLTHSERELLAHYRSSGTSKRECSRLLNRPLSTIKAELKRNSCTVLNRDGQKIRVYVGITAQAKAEQRKLRSAHNKQPLKNPEVYAFVTKHLRKGWSPEQIVGRLKKIEHPDDPDWHISFETIYKWIYNQPKNENGLYWYEYLRRKQKKRQTKKGRTVHHSKIPDRVSISQRSEEINNRTVFGHWEGDSIEGKRRVNTAGLHTEVERMSRKITASKVKSLTSRQAYYAQCRIFGNEPKCAVKSTTLDNGRETHEHFRLRHKFSMFTFHAHPYSSFERGTNEHGNWHLRYYFPKGTDFKKVSRNELQAAVDEINDRPREILGFKTANEVYDQLVENEQGV